MPGPFTISLCMIVRDEERCITRCLESVRDLVDQLVVVDTGSTDRTVALARAAGAEVHHFAWIDDFSAARNRSLEAATGDWCLIMDADEWLEDGAAELAALREQEPDFIGVVQVVSVSAGGTRQSGSIGRVLPASVRFVHRVHEQPDSDLPLRHLGIRLGHDGYQGARGEAKGPRYEKLIRTELRERPEDPYLHFQLGQALIVQSRWEEAADAFDTAYALTGVTTAASRPWQHALVTRFLLALTQCGRTQDALDLGELEMSAWKSSADFLFLLGSAMLQHALAHPQLADDLLPMIESCWLGALELGDSDLPGSLEGRGTHLAAHNLVVLYEQQGREDDARRYRPLAEPPAARA